MSDGFYRICNQAFFDNEEVRIDESSESIHYIGVAVSGTPESSAFWSIVRKDFENGKPTRIRYLSGVSWDSRGSANWG